MSFTISSDFLPPWTQKIGALIFFIIFLAIGLFIGKVGWELFEKSGNSGLWPATQGIVIDSHIETSRSDGTTMYSAEVLYEYSVSGKKYSSNSIDFSETSSSAASYANKIVDKYPKESVLSVYYNPSDPYEAVLEPGRKFSDYWIIGVSVIFVIVGVGGIINTIIKWH